MDANLTVAWVSFLLGSVAGILTGLRFHHADWLGGYASWSRRMIRLGHIAFFGLGLLNVAFVSTAGTLGLSDRVGVSSVLLILGTFTMPFVCYLSAWRPGFRSLFAIPALSVTIAALVFLVKMVRS